MKMKFTLPGLLLMILVLGLAACSGQAATSNSETDATSTTPSASSLQLQGTPQPLQTGTESQLATGTLLLSDSDHPVDAEQAQKLLPLWKAVKALSSSDTAAAEEIAAVYKQIEKAMTPEQMALIQGYSQNPQEAFQKLSDLGLMPEGPMGGMGGNITPEMRATAQAMRESGDFPQGGFPGGGFGGGGDGNFTPPSGGGGNFTPPSGGGGQGFVFREGGDMSGEGFSPELMATRMAEGGGRGNFGMRSNTLFIEAVIAYLEGILNPQ